MLRDLSFIKMEESVEYLRFKKRAVHFSSVMLSEEGNRILHSEELTKAKETAFPVFPKGDRWYEYGNWVLDYILETLRKKNPKRTDLNEPI